MLNVLFLDSGNTSHSLIAAAILNASGDDRFRAYRAGCLPTGSIGPELLDLLRERNLPIDGLHSRGLRELTGADGPSFAFVIALSGLAAASAAELTFHGDPVVARWHLDNEEESEREPSVWALRDSFWILSRRIKIFTSLPHGTASRHSLQRRLQALQSWQ